MDGKTLTHKKNNASMPALGALLEGIKKKALLLTIVCIFLMKFDLIVTHASATTIRVTTVNELYAALKNVKPGDEIVIAEGTYIGMYGEEGSGKWFSWFFADANGTKKKPITIRSENPAQKSALKGGLSVDSGYALHITGNYWIIQDIKFTNAQSGIVLDNSNYSQIINCEVYHVGQEGIQIRDNSCKNTIDGCKITNTGKSNPGYGEGIYVGSAMNMWYKYGSSCNNNKIKNCKLGPGIAAEHIDIKEGTYGTIVETCRMNGTGITGKNYADSFIDVKGNNSMIKGNACYRNSNKRVTDAFQVHNQLKKWGRNNFFYNNKLYMDNVKAYIVNAYSNTSAIVKNNTRYPEGNMYTGKVKGLNPKAYKKPAAKFNTLKRVLNNVDKRMEYSTNRGKTWKKIKGKSVSLSKIKSSTLVENGIWVIRRGEGIAFKDSSVQKIKVSRVNSN